MKSAIVQIDAAPFRQYYQQHYGTEVRAAVVHDADGCLVGSSMVNVLEKKHRPVDCWCCPCTAEQSAALEPYRPDHAMRDLQIGLKKKTAAGAAAAAKEAEEHAKEADQKKSNHLQRKLKARTQQHKLDEVRPLCSLCLLLSLFGPTSMYKSKTWD